MAGKMDDDFESSPRIPARLLPPQLLRPKDGVSVPIIFLDELREFVLHWQENRTYPHIKRGCPRCHLPTVRKLYGPIQAYVMIEDVRRWVRAVIELPLLIDLPDEVTGLAYYYQRKGQGCATRYHLKPTAFEGITLLPVFEIMPTLKRVWNHIPGDDNGQSKLRLA